MRRIALAIAAFVVLTSGICVSAQDIVNPQTDQSKLIANKGQLPGTTTNDSANAGAVGQYIESVTNNTTATVTISNASPGIVTWAANTLNIGSGVNFTTTGGLPTGLSVGTNYYVCSASFVNGTSFAVSISLANALAGTCVNTSSSGSGVQTGVSTILIAANTTTNVTGVSLTAGDWDITCDVNYTLTASASVSTFIASISTAVSLPQTPGNVGYFNTGANVPGGGSEGVKVGPTRKSITSTTTYFCNTFVTFTVDSTLATWGIIRARRTR